MVSDPRTPFLTAGIDPGVQKRLIIFTCYFRPICLPPKDEDFLEAGDSGKYIFAGLGHTSDYYTKYEDITGELTLFLWR